MPPSVSVVVPDPERGARAAAAPARPGGADAARRRAHRGRRRLGGRHPRPRRRGRRPGGRRGHPRGGAQPRGGRGGGALLVFLDADVVPPPRFLELAVGEFEARRLDVATCLAVPLSRRWVDRALHGAANASYLATAGVAPHGSGFCLLARTALHEAIRGFAEHLPSGEDHDYARRGAARGRYAVLRRVAIPVSVRRLDQQGRLALVGAYLAAEPRREVGQPGARLLRRPLDRVLALAFVRDLVRARPLRSGRR